MVVTLQQRVTLPDLSVFFSCFGVALSFSNTVCLAPFLSRFSDRGGTDQHPRPPGLRCQQIRL